MDDTKILASDPNFGNVSVCAGGVVHINLPHVTLKFLPADFVRFSDLVAEARGNAQEQLGQESGRPHLHVVHTKTDTDSESSPDDTAE